MGRRTQRNNQRSNTKNPNNQAHKAAMDNRANQLNPNNRAFKKLREGNARVK